MLGLKNRGGHPGGLQSGVGRQTGGRAGANHYFGHAAPPDFFERLGNFIKLSISPDLRLPRNSKTINAVKAGEVNIIIGTHRLVSKVAFNNLGLLIIDEEQKVWGEGKDKLKELKGRKPLTCVTLTATPIHGHCISPDVPGLEHHCRLRPTASPSPPCCTPAMRQLSAMR